jgi:hypothetical protein
MSKSSSTNSIDNTPARVLNQLLRSYYQVEAFSGQLPAYEPTSSSTGTSTTTRTSPPSDGSDDADALGQILQASRDRRCFQGHSPFEGRLDLAIIFDQALQAAADLDSLIESDLDHDRRVQRCSRSRAA